MSVLLGEEGGEEFFREGEEIASTLLEAEIRNYQFRVSRSHSAWFPSALPSGVILCCLEKCESEVR